jgi:hypothetical protein
MGHEKVEFDSEKEVCRGFPLSRQTNAGKCFLNYVMFASFHMLPNPLFMNNPIIRRSTVCATYRAVKESTNK